MGKKKTKKLTKGNQKDDRNPILSDLHGENLKHRTCWRHLAASVHGVQGKATKEEMDELRNRFERTSPCLLWHITHCNKRSKRKCQGLSRQRWKMDNFTFDDHLDNIWRSLSEDKRSSLARVRSICFSLYKSEPSKGLNLIKEKEIFSKDYVFVPIVCWDHWRLVIFCHFGEDEDSEARTRCILLLDSVEMGAREIEADIRKFVFDIFKAEGRPEIKDDIYQIPLLIPEVPQQRNDVDCGRFVLYFIEQFVHAAPENFSISNGYPYFMETEWFSLEKFEDFCKKLDKELPRQARRMRAPRRLSQRIRKAMVISKKSSRQKFEVISID